MKSTPLSFEPAFMLEALEGRVAPASISFADADGDQVRVTTSKGTNNDLNAVATVMGGVLYKLDLASQAAIFKGTTVNVSVYERTSGSNGFVDVGFIDATGIDLGAVTVTGDIGKIVAGDTNLKTAGLASLTAQSVGIYGNATQGGSGDLVWAIQGNTGAVKIAGDVTGAYMHWVGTTASVTSIAIGGSLKGGTTAFAGEIYVENALGSISVGGDLQGNTGDYSGSIFAIKIGKVSIGGDLKGSTNQYTGGIHGGSIGDVTVGGNLLGGASFYTGSIISEGSIGAVTINGYADGDVGYGSGSVYATGDIKSVTVSDYISGDSGNYSGAISSQLGKIGNVTVLGAVYGSNGDHSGSISSATGLGNINVGILSGFKGAYSGSITTGLTAKIGDVTVTGSVISFQDTMELAGEHSASIEGGTIGKVSIGHDLIGGNAYYTGVIHAAVNLTSVEIGGNLVGGTGAYSTGGIVADTASAGGAKVTSIVIGGDILGGGTSFEQVFNGYIDINGSVAKFVIGGSLKGSNGESSANVDVDKVGTLTIGGDIVGGNSNYSGYFDTGAATSIVVKGGLKGGSGQAAGYLYTGIAGSVSVGLISDYGFSTGVSIAGGGGYQSGSLYGDSVGKLTVAGSIYGGYTPYSGVVSVVNAKDVSVGGSIGGFYDNNTGNITILQKLTGKLVVNGSVAGGDNRSYTGTINVGTANSIEIKGGIFGGNSTGGGVINSGGVFVTGKLTALTIGGDLVSGSSTGMGNLNNGGVRAGSIGTMLVKGDVIGTAAQHVLITGQASTLATKGPNLAISSLTVNGSVTYADILGGYGITGTTNGGDGGNFGGNAQIGTVTIKNGFTNSNIATGVDNVDGIWGNGNDIMLNEPVGPAGIASIAKINLGGPTKATAISGISAQKVTSLVLAGFNLPFTNGLTIVPNMYGQVLA